MKAASIVVTLLVATGCGGRLLPDAPDVVDVPDVVTVSCITPDAGGLCIVDGASYACNACMGSATFVVFDQDADTDGSSVGWMSDCTNVPCSAGLSCIVATPGGHVSGSCE